MRGFNLLIVKDESLVGAIKEILPKGWKIKTVGSLFGERFYNIFVAVSVNDYESKIQKEEFKNWCDYVRCRVSEKGRIVFI